MTSMKRSDLTAGTDYLMHRSNDWKASPYSAKRVTVVSLDGVRSPSGYSNRNNHHDFVLYDGTTAEGVYAYPGGAEVLVRTEDGKVQAVRPATLRGEWETAKAEMDETTRLREERSLRLRRAEQADAERLLAARESLKQMGFTEYVYTQHGSVSGLSLKTLEALITMAGEAADRRDADFVARTTPQTD